jgi:hypothetical protein
MALKVPPHRRLAKALGAAKTRLLEHGGDAIERLLPHIEARNWRIGDYQTSRVTWRDGHRQLSVVIGIEGTGFSVGCAVRRLSVPEGVGAISRTIAVRERAICETVVSKLSVLVNQKNDLTDEVCQAIADDFDELVVSDHLRTQHALRVGPASLFRALRELAGQTYENKAITFGCTIDSQRQEDSPPGADFPATFFRKKRYRALSDGYYTTYCLSSAGALVGFRDLVAAAGRPAPRSYFPDWCKDLVALDHGKLLAIALTRHGDIVVLDGGSLRFTYRFGAWQYWNHSHLVDLLRNSARVQHVPKKTIPRVVGALYRAALDVSFRRSGGLFVILRNQQRLHDVVRPSDCIDDPARELLHRVFDDALPARRIQDLPRSIVVELAALDGAVVLSNQGRILAYGAVLQPKQRGTIGKEEGSRTKAAVGASNYGLAVKVSSDGQLAVFVDGREFITV